MLPSWVSVLSMNRAQHHHPGRPPTLRDSNGGEGDGHPATPTPGDYGHYAEEAKGPYLDLPDTEPALAQSCPQNVSIPTSLNCGSRHPSPVCGRAWMKVTVTEGRPRKPALPSPSPKLPPSGEGRGLL